jgi:cell division protein FtsI/penicillin-binding protein 2
MRKTETKTGYNRLFYMRAVLCVFAALVLLRLFLLSVVKHDFYRAEAQDQHGYSQKITPRRGEIFVRDTNGNSTFTVATTTSKDLVYVVPPQVMDIGAASKRLSEILGMPEKDISAKIAAGNKKQYLVIMKQITDEQSQKVRTEKIPGVYIDSENMRYYPEGEFLSQVLGFVGYKDGSDEKEGLYGIEKYLQKVLAGTPGSISGEADKRGAWITAGDRSYTPAEDGSNLILTIDRSIQHQVENVLRESVETHGAESGVAIVADPKTGAILAMADYPSFNPNEYNKAKDHSVFLNSPTLEAYEPGSTMKGVTMAAGIDLGLISPETLFNDPGEVKVDGYTIKNSDGKSHGTQPMTYALNHSLNTAAIYVEKLVGNQRFLDYLKKFGFGKATEIELPEGLGNLKNLNSNITVNYYTASFGQGITTTPIQMLQSYIPLANGGKLIRPYIVDSVVKPNGKVEKHPTDKGEQVISTHSAAMVTKMMVDVVENGYGKRAGVKGYWIGGKTGTAQIASGGKYDQN